MPSRTIRRYLDLLRGALLDEHYLENELRIGQLLASVPAGRILDPDGLADPARYRGEDLARLRQERRAGATADGGGDGLAYAGALGRVRLDHLERCLDAIREEGVPGDLVAAGVGRGGAAVFLRGCVEAHDVPERRVWVADRFDGAAAAGGPAAVRFPADLNTVRETFARFDLLDDRVVFLQGAPAATLATAPIGEIALLHVGLRDPDAIVAVLAALHERVAPGGFVVVDAYGAAGCAAAVDGFRAERGLAGGLQRVDASAAAWRAPGSRDERRPSPAPPVRRRDLAVVVVVHDMRRQGARTLHSLSRAYQRGVEELDYEVVVVENGSAPDQRLGDELVRSFGPEFRYLDLGPDAPPSPVPAVNRGIAATDARNVAVMIDGAHLLTPGVLRYGMLGLSAYAPAIVSTKQWYLGPGQQPQMVAGGYDADLEERLLGQVRWPVDGYRLFEIGHFIGDRDWLDGDWESNCLFAPRALLDQVGGMDEAFSMPGGGFANLDFFERLVGSPGVTLVSILGEGSFHQVHGGTTTNAVEPAELVRSYDDHYAELRGHRFQVPPPPRHYVGSIPFAARRIKPRRVNTFRHFRDAHVNGSTRRPGGPLPVPQDLKTDFIDAFWRSDQWHAGTWLGRRTHRPPTDLFVYQELLSRLRPDWVIETRTGNGGRALFLASVCDLLDHGRVLSIDGHPLAERPDHPRVTYLAGDPVVPAIAGQAREIVGDDAALVILGGGAGPKVTAAFHHYAPFVPVGSYVVVEDTILEGNPVWADFGRGPVGAVHQIVGEGDFVRDQSLERFALTFNVDGFLKRIR